jgi:hypothetical protein
MARSSLYYEHRVARAAANTESIQKVIRAPHLWMLSHIPRNSKICIQKHSEWTFPGLPQVGARIIYGPFDYPYTDPAAMARFEPPTLQELEAACDFVALNGFHVGRYNYQIRVVAAAVEERWLQFFRDLKAKYPPQEFSADDPANLWKWVHIHDLNRVSTASMPSCDPADRRRQQLAGPFKHDSGDLYMVEVPQLEDVSDSISDGQRSPLLLCEDSKLLTQAHAIHDEIRRLGGGRYSHWGRWLYLSTSDGTDPNTNGRQYGVILK